MKRIVVKQLGFLIFIVLVIVLLLGVFLAVNARAQDSFLDRVQEWDWEEDWGERRSTFDVRYNRVEGLYLGLRLKKDYWRFKRTSAPALYGKIGYSLKAKEVQGQIGLEKGFFNDYRLALGGEFHRIIDTPDRWIVSDWENTFAAFLMKEDFQDFYMCEGASGYISQNITCAVTLSAEYHYDKLDSLNKNTDWSLFGGKKRFRENPAMSVGEMHSLVARIIIDSRNSRKRTTRGWYIQLEGEHAGGGLDGDFEFDRLLIDMRRYQPLGFGEGLDFRIRMGTSRGSIPWHKSFHLGGLSTLRGFPYKAFPGGPMMYGGNRMLLAQIEYRMGSQDLPDELDWGILEHFNLIIFVDAGWVGYAGSGLAVFKGFKGLSWFSLKSDVGIALANRSGSIRVQIARRLDTGYKPYVLSFRLSRPF